MDKPSEKKAALNSLRLTLFACREQIAAVADIYGLIFDDSSLQPEGTTKALFAVQKMASDIEDSMHGLSQK